MTAHCAAAEHSGLIKRKTRKRCTCECIATWGCPRPVLPRLHLISVHSFITSQTLRYEWSMSKVKHQSHRVEGQAIMRQWIGLATSNSAWRRN